jgi:hypothetical protein
MDALGNLLSVVHEGAIETVEETTPPLPSIWRQHETHLASGSTDVICASHHFALRWWQAPQTEE